MGVSRDEKERRDVDLPRAVLAVKQAATAISVRLTVAQRAETCTSQVRDPEPRQSVSG